jgi:hypothetical protein
MAERNLDLVLPVAHAQLLSAGAGGNEYVDLRPPVGELWIVDTANMLHDDDAAARTILWQWYDGATGVVLWQSAAPILYMVYTQLYGNVESGGKPFYLSNASWIRAGALALVAGHKIVINYVVRRVLGVEPWTNV